MAAYGLYSHIQSNKRRSVALLIGLFFLVYVMVFAGALLAEALSSNAPIEYLIHAALFDFVKAFPFATIGAIICNRLQISPEDDRCRHRRSTGNPSARAPAL
jgi:heat shock protein HtpX